MRRRGEGATVRQLAAEFNRSRGTIHSIIKSARELAPGWHPDRILEITLWDRRGAVWRFTDDAFVSTGSHWLEMTSDRDEELTYPEVVSAYGFGDENNRYLLGRYTERAET